MTYVNLDRSYTTSYWSAISIALSCTIFELTLNKGHSMSYILL